MRTRDVQYVLIVKSLVICLDVCQFMIVALHIMLFTNLKKFGCVNTVLLVEQKTECFVWWHFHKTL